jgi:hypothetical protein
VAHRIGLYKNNDNTVNSKKPVICKMLRRTDKMKVIAVRKKVKGQKGQKLFISDELTKYNFDLLKNLQDHDIVRPGLIKNIMVLKICHCTTRLDQ